MTPEYKQYILRIFRDDIQVAEMNCGSLPDDLDEFAWNMGGDRIEIEETSIPQQN